jgi:glycosyltransferase involved in cell wall biosynthesis
MRHWRIVVHALDRTGPPMLARAFLRWLHAHHPEHHIDVVAFRGGELLADLLDLAPVRVVLDPEEPWDWTEPDPARVARLAARLAGLPAADATLLVSVAAAQALPFLDPERSGAMVTWSVEQGEDLHHAADGHTDRWLAGSRGTHDELVARLPGNTPVWMAPEFVEWPEPPQPHVREHCRAALGVIGDELLVVGAGIATMRKAPDLFLEVALAHQRCERPVPMRFVWLGGDRDAFFHAVRAESQRLGLDDVRFFGSVVDVVPFLAAADVVLHPARLDSFPLVCLHAAGVGTPVVAFSGVGGVPDMLGDAFCGAPFPDVAALHRSLLELADGSRRAQVGAAQRASVLHRYTADVGSPVVLAELEAAVAGASTAPPHASRPDVALDEQVPS